MQEYTECSIEHKRRKEMNKCTSQPSKKQKGVHLDYNLSSPDNNNTIDLINKESDAELDDNGFNIPSGNEVSEGNKSFMDFLSKEATDAYLLTILEQMNNNLEREYIPRIPANQTPGTSQLHKFTFGMQK